MTDARRCVQLHHNLCTPEWDLPGMRSDCNNEWYSVSTHVNFQTILLSRRLPIDTCLVSKKFYKSPLTNYDFGVAMGGLLLKLQNFKMVKLIFGHPVFCGCAVVQGLKSRKCKCYHIHRQRSMFRSIQVSLVLVVKQPSEA